MKHCDDCFMKPYCVARLNDDTVTGCNILSVHRGLISAEEFATEHTDKRGDRMNDGIMLTIGDDGKATLYDDTYDITIHCESKEEQDEVRKALENIRYWTPAMKPPKESGKYLVTAIISFVPDHVGDPDTYEVVTTANYLADTRDSIKWWGNNVEKVLAWMPLPEPYKGVTDGRD